MVVALNRDSHVAMHRQISRLLREEIAKGGYQPGQRIPTELELAKRFDVSRITARQAVEHLVRDRLVVRKQGKGTFVSGPRVRQDLLELRGIYDELVDQGLNPATELLEFKEVVPPARIAERLGTGSRPVFHWRRLYRLSGRPFGVSSVYLRPIKPVDRDTVARHPTYSIIESIFGLTIGHADLAIRHARGRPALCSLLQIPAGDALMELERVSYAADGRALEHTVYHAQAESYEFSVRVRGAVSLASNLKQTA